MRISQRYASLIGGLLFALASPLGATFIANGNFSQGNTGFTSGYSFVTPPAASANPTGQMDSALWNEGTYTISSRPRSTHVLFNNITAPGGSGNMMVVNGAQDQNRVVWESAAVADMNVGWTGFFSLSMASLNPSNNPSVQFVVNNQVVATWMPALDGNWQTFTGSFTITSARPVFRLVNSNTAPLGNDFALTNISVSQTPEPSTAFLLVPAVGALAWWRRRRVQA